MALAKMKAIIVSTEMAVLRDSRLVNYPTVIVCWWDPYSIGDEPAKTYWKLKNAWLRLHKDGRVTLERSEHSYFISKRMAEQLERTGTPLQYLEYSDVFESKLTADLMRKGLIEVGEEVEIHGAVLSYGQSILESLISAVISRFGRGRATKNKILQFLTRGYPYGGGWLKRTAELSEKVGARLKIMVSKGVLTFDERTHEYKLTHKPAVTRLGGK